MRKPCMLLQVQLICTCCRQPHDAQKRWEDQMSALIVGVEKYVVCPLCTQNVPRHIFRSAIYRMRCHEAVRRLYEEWAAKRLLGKGK